VFVASNKLANCDKKNKLDHFVKSRTWQQTTVPVVRLWATTRLVQVVIVCDIQPVLHPTTKSFEPSLEVCCFMYLHVGFERLSLNSDSRQRSPRQMTSCCVPSERCKRVRCTKRWIDLSALSKIPITPAALLYIWRYWLNTTATCIGLHGNIWDAVRYGIFCRFHAGFTVMPFRPLSLLS
jgi:hypothetical protein